MAPINVFVVRSGRSIDPAILFSLEPNEILDNAQKLAMGSAETLDPSMGSSSMSGRVIAHDNLDNVKASPSGWGRYLVCRQRDNCMHYDCPASQ